VIAAGVMSGTSADGVDVVLLQLRSLSRRHEPRVLAHVHRRFTPALSAELVRPDTLTAPRIAELGFELARIYARAVRVADPKRRAAVCGMHGQTVWHAPRGARACTLQIGSSAALAQWIGIPVVADMRGADVALGGQGAPIAPFAHWFFTPEKRAPRLVVNFGGIANLTYVGADQTIAAYDVGPAMMLSDAFAQSARGGSQPFDRGGMLSRRGLVVEALVRDVLAHPFMSRRPPKSTGREEFGRHFYEPLFRRYRRASAADVARSLLVATARALRDAVLRDARIPNSPREILLSGGGAKNPVLEAEVRSCFPTSRVQVPTGGVFAPEHHEPCAMALIAARTLRGLPSSVTQVTGAIRPAILGHVHQPSPTVGSAGGHKFQQPLPAVGPVRAR
jgi:anhydro-N-acetylmuramic acid kinase